MRNRKLKRNFIGTILFILRIAIVLMIVDTLLANIFANQMIVLQCKCILGILIIVYIVTDLITRCIKDEKKTHPAWKAR